MFTLDHGKLPLVVCFSILVLWLISYRLIYQPLAMDDALTLATSEQLTVRGAQDPRTDGLLLGLGLAKTGSTSLYTTFCKYALLNANCRAKQPEDKYWHSCVWNNFQPLDTRSLSAYDIAHLLDAIDSRVYYEDCSVPGWLHRSFLDKRTEHRGERRRRSRKRTQFRRWRDHDEPVNHTAQLRRRLIPSSASNAVRGFTAKTTNHFGAIYIPHILAHAMTRHALDFKFYVIFRNPMSRIVSSYIFMVGFEKRYIPERFANISAFVAHDMKNEQLCNIVRELDRRDTALADLDWDRILEQWVLYEAHTRQQCYADRELLQSMAHEIEAADRFGDEKARDAVEARREAADRFGDNEDSPRRRIERMRRKVVRPKVVGGGRALLARLPPAKHGDGDERRERMERVRQQIEARKRVQRRRRPKATIGFTCERDLFRATVGDSC